MISTNEIKLARLGKLKANWVSLLCESQNEISSKLFWAMNFHFQYDNPSLLQYLSQKVR